MCRWLGSAARGHHVERGVQDVGVAEIDGSHRLAHGRSHERQHRQSKQDEVRVPWRADEGRGEPPGVLQDVWRSGHLLLRHIQPSRAGRRFPLPTLGARKGSQTWRGVYPHLRGLGPQRAAGRSGGGGGGGACRRGAHGWRHRRGRHFSRCHRVLRLGVGIAEHREVVGFGDRGTQSVLGGVNGLKVGLLRRIGGHPALHIVVGLPSGAAVAADPAVAR
mmetsp:Transcript_15830/g.45708  ORF Transcript_15830/g.45708 Transcript_15830/m.45708 type:complete len:219 (-) Transcript_15830:509-1165(-)